MVVFRVLIVDVKNHIQDKRLAENIKEFNRHLNHREYILKLLSKELLQNPRYKDILLSGFENKNILIKNLDLFKSFMKENQINILEIGDQKGRVVFRFHRPEDFGDSKIDQKIIQEAIAGKVSTSLETGKSGLGYRTTTPIENYGTLLVGETVDRDFIRSIVDFNNVKMALFSKNKLLASSDEAIDNYIKENLERKNNDRIKYNNSSYYTTSIDYDSHGYSNLDLQFFLMVNEDRIELFVNNIWYLFGGISILIFLFVFILGYIFSNDIIQAIKTLNSAMKNIDDSESHKHLDIQRKDEIGEITKIFILMKDQIFQNQKNLESMIENRTRELELTKERATKAYLDLEASQKQLVQSDKMITLGTMVAGVAHEINTPLGAIKANSENILKSLRTLIQKINPSLSHITREDLERAIFVLELSKESNTAISSREARAIRKKVISKLEAKDRINIEIMADYIVELGLSEALDQGDTIFNHPDLEKYLSIANDLYGIRKKSSVIQASAVRVSKIVKSLKSFMHFDQNEKMIISDLTEGMETVLIILHSKIKYGIEVIKNYGEDVPQIPCYPDELNQVWTNLIHNAIQAMSEKGTLLIDIENLTNLQGTPDIDKRNTEYKGSYVAVSIQDSGTGISPEIRTKIFQAFFTTKPAGEGSGLGLHIIGKILEKHAGALYLESEPGKTRFTVVLPVL
jgi:signal transduction histidine kinase